MKNISLSFIFLSLAFSAFSQTCVRDSSLYVYDSTYLAPPPYTPEIPEYNLAPACMDQPYNQSISLKVPDTFNFQGLLVPLNSISCATSGALTGLPSGITYLCDPPNCVFNANTLGCILLYGTPNNAGQAPDTTELVINISVQSFITIPSTLPAPLVPESHYYLVLAQAGNCIVSAGEVGSPVADMYNVPNPFNGSTIIRAESELSGDFEFEVFDLLGQRLYRERVALLAGFNEFTFEAGNLASGVYLYSLNHPEGKVARRMVVQR